MVSRITNFAIDGKIGLTREISVTSVVELELTKFKECRLLLAALFYKKVCRNLPHETKKILHGEVNEICSDQNRNLVTKVKI